MTTVSLSCSFTDSGSRWAATVQSKSGEDRQAAVSKEDNDHSKTTSRAYGGRADGEAMQPSQDLSATAGDSCVFA